MDLRGGEVLGEFLISHGPSALSPAGVLPDDASASAIRLSATSCDSGCPGEVVELACPRIRRCVVARGSGRARALHEWVTKRSTHRYGYVKQGPTHRYGDLFRFPSARLIEEPSTCLRGFARPPACNTAFVRPLARGRASRFPR